MIRAVKGVIARAPTRGEFPGRGGLKKRPTLVFALTFWICTSAAAAEDGCGKFAWPVSQEREALIAQGQPTLASGASIEPGPDQAFRLLLRQPDEAGFVMQPERKPRIDNWRGGIVRLPAPPQAGIYQVTLSDEAWVDVVQNGGYARSIGSSGRSDCPGLRKTIRFEVASSPIVLQISGASVESISVVVGPAR